MHKFRRVLKNEELVLWEILSQPLGFLCRKLSKEVDAYGDTQMTHTIQLKVT